MAWVPIASFSKAEDAHLLRLRLEAAGIDVQIQDENLVQIDWLLSNAIGGVKVLVAEEFVEEVQEILQAEPPEPLDGDRPTCPACGSSETAPDERPRRFAFLTLLIAGFPFLFGRTDWLCAACGRRWNEKTGVETR